ncbi:MAG TPA: UDP-3-O-(3-hydroxymyristoyl)glucosamine N-acyltransferase, partial [Rhodobacteraceae bacterium]|nr:UDP-3-O-(3-hydroxymyristoyl)glucosamine N-acyltransferase [Paracoccaceae bacterium]
MSYTIAQIGAGLNAEVAGDVDLRVMRAAEPGSAGPDDLALAMSPKYADDLGTARAAMLWPGADWQAMGLQ